MADESHSNQASRSFWIFNWGKAKDKAGTSQKSPPKRISAGSMMVFLSGNRLESVPDHDLTLSVIEPDHVFCFGKEKPT